MDFRGPRFGAEVVPKQVRPVQRTQADGGNAGHGCRRQRQVGDIAQQRIDPLLPQPVSLGLDPLWPSGVELAIALCAGGEVDIHRVVHHKAEIARLGNVPEVGGDAARQLLPRQRAAHRQAQPAGQFAKGLQHRRGLRQMPEAVGRNIDQQMHSVPSARAGVKTFPGRRRHPAASSAR